MSPKEQLERINRELLELLSADTMEPARRNPSSPLAVVDRRMLFGRPLVRETDRGCAVLTRAILHEQLAVIIRNRLVQEPVLLGKLMGPEGALALFTTRVDLAFALGLISERSARTLYLLAEIAGEFTSLSGAMTFDSEPVASRCRKLPRDGLGGKKSLRERFLSAGETLFAEIQRSRLATTPLSPMSEGMPQPNRRCRKKITRLAGREDKPGGQETLADLDSSSAEGVRALTLAVVEFQNGSPTGHGEALGAYAAPAAAHS